MFGDREFVGLAREGSPYRPVPTSRERAERALANLSAGEDPAGWHIVDIPSCRCCGEPAAPNLRCAKHQGRNPCAIDGCRRTAAAHRGVLADDTWLCSEHWRRHCPPHSKLRRAYNRFWRIAKRDGWTPQLARRFNRFWDGLIARARRNTTEGFLDIEEIHRLFGLDEPPSTE